MTEYEAVIGLEVHAQIHTAAKMFCACPVLEDTGDLIPNISICPICTAQPGALPTINRRAVELALMTGLALNCTIPPFNRFARKSYFYPDLPKGYQISQYALPMAVDGGLEIETGQGRRRIGIRDVHLEEDTGKLAHVDGASLVDFNRAGVPLIEVVSQPDLRSAEEVVAYATHLRLIFVYLGINSGDMEKGVMRFEASVSVRPRGSDALNPRHEIKNLNSFRALARAVAYEIAWQTEVLERGGTVAQQTMGWDERTGRTTVQRSKEHAHDYRYFPEPDLPSLEVSREWVVQLARRLPELPAARRARFMAAYRLPSYDADVLVADKAAADTYERVLAHAPADPKIVANWVTGILFRLAKEAGRPVDALPVAPAALADVIAWVERGTITLATGREVLAEMVATGQSAAQIVAARGLAQMSDVESLRQVVEQVVAEHPAQAAEYLAGKQTVRDWLMGQVMRATRGRADPQMVRALLAEALESRHG
ncbi:MAG: Asp-tRNA(Asn)/Glu-tRNA(Gln) amidotransferase subunit GatB [Anaerolineae bacterium]|nr:Asp-tRNA(Asn)/Glu-tRNA(Gln) amidotransferase subunit GatB [Anaerolineae bacterium]